MILEKNLKAIGNRDPAVAEQLRKARPLPAVDSVTAKSGHPVPVYRDRPLYSRYDPRREAEAWAATTVSDTPSLEHVYFIFGFGLGYHVEALLRKDPYAHLVVCEPSLAWWRRLLELRDVRHIIKHERVTVLPGADFSLGSDAFNRLATGTFTGEVKMAELPVYKTLFPDEYAQWANQALDSLRHLRVGLATREWWKKRWLSNSIANLIEVFANPGVADMRGSLAGYPAVMVAAGPSLEDHLEILRSLIGKVPVFAAGTGLRPLVQAGIHPDYVVSIDPGEGNYKALKDYLDAPCTTLVFISSLHPQIVKEYTGPKIAAFADQEHLPRWIGEMAGWDRGILPDAGSVAIPTLDFVLQMGCSEVVLLGQDLSFRDPKKYYAGQREIEVKDYFPRRSVSGTTVYTTKPMLAMLRELEARIAKANRAGCVVYNASRTGLAIKGTTGIDFAAWARGHGGRRFEHPETGLDHPTKDEVMDRIIEPLRTIRTELRTVQELSGSAVRTLEPLCRALPDGATLGRRLNPAVGRLNEAMRSAAYTRVIRRTVENLDILVRTRTLNLATASPPQIKSHLALLHTFAEAVQGNSAYYCSELERLIP